MILNSLLCFVVLSVGISASTTAKNLRGTKLSTFAQLLMRNEDAGYTYSCTNGDSTISDSCAYLQAYSSDSFQCLPGTLNVLGASYDATRDIDEFGPIMRKYSVIGSRDLNGLATVGNVHYVMPDGFTFTPQESYTQASSSRSTYTDSVKSYQTDVSTTLDLTSLFFEEQPELTIAMVVANIQGGVGANAEYTRKLEKHFSSSEYAFQSQIQLIKGTASINQLAEGQACDPAFYSQMMNLAGPYDQRKVFALFQYWGTHIVVQADLGGSFAQSSSNAVCEVLSSQSSVQSAGLSFNSIIQGFTVARSVSSYYFAGSELSSANTIIKGGNFISFLEALGGTLSPTTAPTESPTIPPSEVPTEVPTLSPSAVPTISPSEIPTAVPTFGPTASPTTIVPTCRPTTAPSFSPSVLPTEAPTDVPSQFRTSAPTNAPSIAPTAVPTDASSNFPTVVPSDNPTGTPSDLPTDAPTSELPVELNANVGLPLRQSLTAVTFGASTSPLSIWIDSLFSGDPEYDTVDGMNEQSIPLFYLAPPNTDVYDNMLRGFNEYMQAASNSLAATRNATSPVSKSCSTGSGGGGGGGGGKNCFSAADWVTLKDGSRVSFPKLKIGDEVLSVDTKGRVKYSKVAYLPHRVNDAETDFLVVYTESNKVIRITDDHFILIGNKQEDTFEQLSLVKGEQVQEGQYLFLVDGTADLIVSISRETLKGAYSAITNEEFLVVNDIIVSPYAFNHWLSHTFYNLHRALYAWFPSMVTHNTLPLYELTNLVAYMFHTLTNKFFSVVMLK